MNEHPPTDSESKQPVLSDSASFDASDSSLEPEAAPVHHPWLERYIWLIAVTTFFLIILGGTVTSKDAGLAVPDWPHTFGYNMILYPPSKWVGGVFWEHTHRLLATLVGVLALILMGWALFAARLSMTLRILAAVILVLVSVQGVMGGLRVTEISTSLGVVHGVTGQLFFALLLITAIMASKRWLEHTASANSPSKTNADTAKRPQSDKGVSSVTLAYLFLVVLVIQLALGATMRHYRAGLAIPDFPTAYGQLVPPLSAKGIEHAMDTHAGGGDLNLEGYYSPFKVSVHYAHRLWAIMVVVMAVILITALASRDQLKRPALKRLSLAIIALLVVQVALGALVIWTGRHAEVATAHQTTGAAILGIATILMMQLKMLPTDGTAMLPDASEQSDHSMTQTSHMKEAQS